MDILTRLERRFEKYAIANLTLYLIVGQVIVYVFMYSFPSFSQLFYLQGSLFLQGQWWRVITMLFMPLSDSPLWVVLTWYIYYLYGTALEATWGSFRYLIYLCIVYTATIVSALLFPHQIVTNGYIFTSLFLAFAYLFPDFKLYIFFIIPIKVKWLALLAWAGLIGSFLLGSTETKVLVGISVSNFLLFFGNDLMLHVTDRLRGVSHKTAHVYEDKKAYMVCAVCHATEKDRKIFYYCHTCVPDACYCEDHIGIHTHIK